jgi:hypothetical protein
MNFIKSYYLTLIFVLIGLLVTLMIGFGYVGAQQVLRLSANDPQIQMTHDLQNISQENYKYIFSNKIDINQSLTPFVIIYDSEGKLIASQAILDGHSPVVPQGVFKYVTNHGEDRFTWQPRGGVKIAAVMTKYSPSGYILIGRSLKEVEKRIDQLFFITGLAWVGSMIIIGVIFLLVYLNLRIKNESDYLPQTGQAA